MIKDNTLFNAICKKCREEIDINHTNEHGNNCYGQEVKFFILKEDENSFPSIVLAQSETQEVIVHITYYGYNLLLKFETNYINTNPKYAKRISAKELKPNFLVDIIKNDFIKREGYSCTVYKLLAEKYI